MSILTEVLAAPGTMLRLAFSGGKDANNIAIDDTSGAGFVSIAAQNNHGAAVGGYTNASMSYASSAWHINVWGDKQTRSVMPTRWTGQITTFDGTIIRAAQHFNVLPATPIRDRYMPAVTCRFRVKNLLNAGVVPDAGWTVLCNITTEAGEGAVLLNAVAGVNAGAQSAYYDADGELYMLPNVTLLVTLQVLDAAGNKVLAQEWLLTAL